MSLQSTPPPKSHEDPSPTSPRQHGAPLLAKRLLDVALAGPAMVLLSPVLALAAASIRVTMGPPVLFRQRRPGRGGRSFSAYKFRSMHEALDANGHPLPDGARLTGLGQWLRRTSVDELPQLWNVLRGEMSLVGPRPLLERYLERYSPAQARRHEVLPGLTGWAQVQGRNATTWEQRFADDVWYVDHWSLGLDLKILLLTVVKVLRGDGVSQPGHETMPEFRGSQPER
ncbi:MAG: sugar transferase [Proteobacteria bacterium]|nr:sugar transferase [Pseudomonadota bacterium]